MTSSGSAVSAKAVKPRRSRKNTVTSRRWVARGSSAPPATMSSAKCGEKKRLSRPSCSSWPTCSAVVGGHLQAVPVQVEDFFVVGSTEARAASGHHVQHGLEIRRRGADDPQDLGRRRLLLQGLGQLLFEARAFRSLTLEGFPQRLDLGSQLSLGDWGHHSTHRTNERSGIARRSCQSTWTRSNRGLKADDTGGAGRIRPASIRPTHSSDP